MGADRGSAWRKAAHRLCFPGRPRSIKQPGRTTHPGCFLEKLFCAEFGAVQSRISQRQLEHIEIQFPSGWPAKGICLCRRPSRSETSASRRNRLMNCSCNEKSEALETPRPPSSALIWFSCQGSETERCPQRSYSLCSSDHRAGLWTQQLLHACLSASNSASAHLQSGLMS